MDTVHVGNADWMIGTAVLLEDGIDFWFADGLKVAIPHIEVPEAKARPGSTKLELPNSYRMVLQAVGGENTE